MITREELAKLLSDGRKIINTAARFDKSSRMIIKVCTDIFYYPEQVGDLEKYDLPYLAEEVDNLIRLVNELTKLDRESDEFINLVRGVIPEAIRDIANGMKRKNKLVKLMRQGLKNNIVDVLDRAKGNTKVLGLIKKVI